MKKRMLSLLLSLLLLLPLFSVCGEEAAPRLTKDLVILYTSDVHCGVNDGWGYAGLYAVKQYYEQNAHVLLVDDGDALQGGYIGISTRGEAIIDIMNTVGYDLAIPGNHDFDYGVDNLLSVTEKANFPYLSCNFNKEGNLLFDPWTIREIDGVKFGFIGITTPETLRSSTPAFFQDEQGRFIYGFMEDESGEKLYAAVQKAVDDVRSAGADYVIALAHLGNQQECSPWMYSQVVENTVGIDAVLDGHSHDTDQVVMKNREGKDVVRAACGTKLANIGVLTVTPDGAISSSLLRWSAGVSAPTLLGIQNPVADTITAELAESDELLRRVVGKTAVDLYIYDPTAVRADGSPVRIIRNAETNLGDLCVDAFLYAAQGDGADIALLNSGAIRHQLPAGDLTMDDIISVLPFGNSMVIIEATGQQILDELECSVSMLPGEFGSFLQVAGLSFEVDPSVPTPCVIGPDSRFLPLDPACTRRVSNVLVKGKPIDPQKTYRVASTSYVLLDGGDGVSVFDGCKVVQQNGSADFQVLIQYITDVLGGTVDASYEKPYGEGRIRVLEKP